MSDDIKRGFLPFYRTNIQSIEPGGSDDVFRAEIAIEYDEEKGEPVPHLVTPFNDVYNAINSGKVVIATIETEVEGTATSMTAYGTSAYDEDGDKWVYFTILDGETSNIHFIYFYNGDKDESGIEHYGLIENPEEFAEGGEKYLLQGSNKGAEWLETDRAVGQMKVNFESLNSPLSMTSLEIQMHNDIGEVYNAISNNKLVYGKVYAAINGVTHQLMLFGTAAHTENRLNPDTQQYDWVNDVTFFCSDNGIGGDSGFHEYYLTLTGTGENLYGILQQSSSNSPEPSESDIYDFNVYTVHGEFVCDKSYSELTTALDAGKKLVLHCKGPGYDDRATLELIPPMNFDGKLMFAGVGIGESYQQERKPVTSYKIYLSESYEVPNQVSVNVYKEYLTDLNINFFLVEGTIGCNSSYTEITAELANGRKVVATYDQTGDLIYNLVSRSGLHSGYEFEAVSYGSIVPDTGFIHRIEIDSSDRIGYNKKEFTTTHSTVIDPWGGV